MSLTLSPGLFENEDGDGNNNLPFGDSDNAVWSMLPTSTNNVNGGPTIKFTNRTLGTIMGSRIINTADKQHTISWDYNQEIEAVNATWQVKGTALASASKFDSAPMQPRDSLIIFLNDTSVQLQVGSLKLDGDPKKWLAQDMNIKVYWNKGGKSGSTTSGVFAVFDNIVVPVPYEELDARLSREMARSEQNVGVDTVDESEGNGDFSPSAIVSSSTSVTTTPTSSPSGALDVTSGRPTENPSDQAGGGGGGGGGGLPAGAIAGIVVGAVLGIGLIAFLLWFFLRRRRRAEDASKGAYGSGQGPHDYLADKESHARVTESPQSPYSDDGQHQHPPQPQPHLAPSQQEAAVPASFTSPTGRRSFAPYEEHTPTAARSLDDVNRGSGARSSTPNVNSNVSHLIEDGMTEDEIRRLEEEERALDAAIEQAGQTQGQRR